MRYFAIIGFFERDLTMDKNTKKTVMLVGAGAAAAYFLPALITVPLIGAAAFMYFKK